MTPEQKKPHVVVLCGPTGIGKTSVGIELADIFSAEIVSADSMQIYRWMDIGTAKPTPVEMTHTPHHMVDVIDPDEPFDAAKYSQMARKIVYDLNDRGSLSLVVGGTGFYIKSLLHGLFEAIPVNPAVRRHLKKQVEIYGISHLHKRLQRWDPKTANRLHPNDIYRILRALEIVEATGGKSISDYQTLHGFNDCLFRVLKIGLSMDRESLYDRINHRVDLMIRIGLMDEVKDLLQKGFTPDLKSMQSIGYRHMVDHLLGRVSWDETVRTIKRDTRRYAKRQFTWFGRDSEIVWTEPDRIDKIRDHIDRFLQSG